MNCYLGQEHLDPLLTIQQLYIGVKVLEGYIDANGFINNYIVKHFNSIGTKTCGFLIIDTQMVYEKEENDAIPRTHRNLGAP